MKTFCWFFFLFSFSFMICTVYCGFQHIKWKACSDTLLSCQLVHRRVLLFWRRICRAAPSLPSFFFFFKFSVSRNICLLPPHTEKFKSFRIHRIQHRDIYFLVSTPKSQVFLPPARQSPEKKQQLFVSKTPRIQKTNRNNVTLLQRCVLSLLLRPSHHEK